MVVHSFVYTCAYSDFDNEIFLCIIRSCFSFVYVSFRASLVMFVYSNAMKLNDHEHRRLSSRIFFGKCYITIIYGWHAIGTEVAHFRDETIYYERCITTSTSLKKKLARGKTFVDSGTSSCDVGLRNTWNNDTRSIRDYRIAMHVIIISISQRSELLQMSVIVTEPFLCVQIRTCSPLNFWQVLLQKYCREQLCRP